jgi:phosphoglycolate phosphatase
MIKPLFAGAQPQLILFDLDGTLIDSAPDLADAIDSMLAQLDLPSAGEQHVRGWVGNGATLLVKRALNWALETHNRPALTRELQAQGHAAFLTAYHDRYRNRTRLYPGVLEALQQWARADMPMAVVTNKPMEFVAPLLTHFQIDGCFGTALGGDSLPEKKPHPRPLLHLCEHFDVAPKHTLMVGDSRNDVEAARAAAMPVVCVSYGYNHGESVEASQPDLIVDSLMALL